MKILNININGIPNCNIEETLKLLEKRKKEGLDNKTRIIVTCHSCYNESRTLLKNVKFGMGTWGRGIFSSPAPYIELLCSECKQPIRRVWNQPW